MSFYTLQDAPRAGRSTFGRPVPNMVTSFSNQSVVPFLQPALIPNSTGGAIPETTNSSNSLYFVEHLFPSKLWMILHDAERLGYADIVSWVDNGTAFQIHDRERVVPILEKYFSISMYKSFLRQLQAYGFQRLRPNAMDDPHKDSRPKRDHHRGKWKHNFFRKDNRNLCNNITRDGKPKGTIENETKKSPPKQGALQQQHEEHQNQYRIQLMHQNQILQQQQALHHVPLLPNHLPLHQQNGMLHHFSYLPQHGLVGPLGAVPRLPPSISAQEQQRTQMQLRMTGAPTSAAQSLLATVNYNNPLVTTPKKEAATELEKAQLDILERRRRLAEAQERAQQEAEALAKAEAAMAKARTLPNTTETLNEPVSESTNILKRPCPSTSSGPVKKRLSGEKPSATILGVLDNAFSSFAHGDEKKTSDDNATEGTHSEVVRDAIHGAGVGLVGSTNSSATTVSTERIDVFAKTAAAAIALPVNGPGTERQSTSPDATGNALKGSSTVPQVAGPEASVPSRTMTLPNASHVVTNLELEAARKMIKIPGTIEQINKAPVNGLWELVHPAEFRQSTALAKALPEVVSKSSGLPYKSYQILSKQLSPPKSIRVPEGWNVSKDPVYFVVDPTKASESSQSPSSDVAS